MIQVYPHGTIQLCSTCGATVTKTQSQRFHRCDCGLVLHRDINAARNILSRADREGKLPARLQPLAGKDRCRDVRAFDPIIALSCAAA